MSSIGGVGPGDPALAASIAALNLEPRVAAEIKTALAQIAQASVELKPALVDAQQLAVIARLLELDLSATLIMLDAGTSHVLEAAAAKLQLTTAQIVGASTNPAQALQIQVPQGYTPQLDPSKATFAVADAVALSDAELTAIANDPNPAASPSAFVSKLIRPALFADQLFGTPAPIGTATTPVATIAQAFVGKDALVFALGEHDRPFQIVLVNSDLSTLSTMSPKQAAAALQKVMLDALHAAFGDEVPVNVSVAVSPEGLARITLTPKDARAFEAAPLVDNLGFVLLADTKTAATDKLVLTTVVASAKDSAGAAATVIANAAQTNPALNPALNQNAKGWTGIFETMRHIPEQAGPQTVLQNLAAGEGRPGTGGTSNGNGSGASAGAAGVFGAANAAQSNEAKNDPAGLAPGTQQAMGWFVGALMGPRDPSDNSPVTAGRIAFRIGAVTFSVALIGVIGSSISIGASITILVIGVVFLLAVRAITSAGGSGLSGRDRDR